jgi:hypothetical protein
MLARLARITHAPDSGRYNQADCGPGGVETDLGRLLRAAATGVAGWHGVRSADTEENTTECGKPSGGVFPQARVVTLTECGSHLSLGAHIGPVTGKGTGERSTHATPRTTPNTSQPTSRAAAALPQPTPTNRGNQPHREITEYFLSPVPLFSPSLLELEHPYVIGGRGWTVSVR